MRGLRNIFLIGPRGSGKTAVGKQLARRLGMRFVDSDQIIVQRSGADIPLIFEREGEAGFRQREAQVVQELALETDVVLATGGGAVLNADSRQKLRQHGWVVYLQTSVDCQARRATRNRQRPLLQVADPRQRLQELMNVREPLYQEIADLLIDTDDTRVNVVVDKAAREWQAQL